jgi:hypothetical protein
MLTKEELHQEIDIATTNFTPNFDIPPSSPSPGTFSC